MNPFSASFEHAAQLLETGSPGQGAGGALLGRLGYDVADSSASLYRIPLLRAAARLNRVFQIAAPDAPGLVFFGAEADPAAFGLPGAKLSIGGTGLTLGEAFAACMGEAIELLSQFAPPDATFDRAVFTEQVVANGPTHDFVNSILTWCGLNQHTLLDWSRARRLTDGAPVWFPADLCLRRPEAVRNFTAPHRLGTGCGAGRTMADAELHALLELIERDAAALWWRGGRPGRPVPADSEAGATAANLLSRLRQGLPHRTVRLLDITSDLGIPVVAAVSARDDGLGFAFGLAARPSLVQAACAALFELGQMELAHVVVAAKLKEAGESALNDTDRGHLKRGEMIDLRRCDLLWPAGAPFQHTDHTVTDAAATLQQMVTHLANMGIETYSIDLTRPALGLPAVRVLTPTLQVEPSHWQNPRLARTIAETGGGTAHTGDVALF